MVDVKRHQVARKRWRTLIIPVVAILLLGVVWLAVFLDLSDSETLRYRLTYEVEVDGSIRSGTGVVQIRVVERHRLIGTSSIGFEVTGEAVVIDLGDGRYLFSLLDGRLTNVSGWGTHSTTPEKLIMLAFEGQSSSILASYRFLRTTSPSVELPFELLPALATFEDIDDPTSARLVDPDDLATHFGPEVSIKQVTVEITNDAVTKGRIGEILVWLNSWNERVMTPQFNFYKYQFQQ